MTSSIDSTKPDGALPTTASVRSNFSIASSEITALQTFDSDLASTATDDGTKGFHLVSYPPLSGETNITDSEYSIHDLRRLGGLGDDSTDNATAMVNAASNFTTIDIHNGIYRVNTNTTVVATIRMLGGQIRIASGVTLTVESVDAPDSDIVFLGDGTLIITSARYSLGWFEGAKANLKWDFLRRGLVDSDPYHLVVPRPKNSDPAATDYGAAAGLMWDVGAPMIFGDPENFAEIELKAGFAAAPAAGNIDSIWEFGGGVKTEMFNITGKLRFNGRNKIDVASLLISGGAHIHIPFIYGNDSPVVVMVKSSTFASNDIYIDHIYGTGIGLDLQTSSSGRISEINVGYIDSDGTQTAGTDCLVRIKGGVRQTNIGHVSMHAVVSGFNDCTVALVLIENETNASPADGIKIGKVSNRSTSITSDGVKIRDNTSAAGAKISLISIYDVHSPGTDAIDIDYSANIFINNVRAGNIRVGSSSGDTWINGPTNRSTMIDSGERTRLNGRITKTVTLNDDIFTTIAVPSDLSGGVVITFGVDSATNQYSGIAYIDTTGSPISYIISGGSNFIVGTGPLTDGTGDGVDLKLNVYARGDGKIYIKNRTGVAGLNIYVEFAG